MSTVPSMSKSNIKRQLIVYSHGEGRCVKISPTDTLSNVRRSILEDFDAEWHTCDVDDNGTGSTAANTTNGEDNGGKFAFRVNDIRIMAKQEDRKNAFDLLDSNAKVELVHRHPITSAHICFK